MAELEDYRARARAWIAEHRRFAPADYGAICPPHLVEHAVDWQRRIHDAGYAGINWPEHLGGQGLTIEHTAAWQVECASAGVPSAFNMVGLVLAGGAILRFGTPEQQAAHLRPTLAAEHLWCQLFSEPGAGSDLGSLTTRAERDGDHYVVNGQKVWCSGGRYSNWGILMARTDSAGAATAHSDPGAGKHDGISFFLFPMDLAGVDVRPLRQMTGEAEFDEVFLTDVELPAEHLLGPLHGGWGVGMAVLTNERGHIGTAVIGLERRLEQLVAIVDADGQVEELGPIERQQLAGLVARGQAYKAMALRQGPAASTAASLMKLGITELMFDAAMLRGGLGGASSSVDGAGASGMLAAPGGTIAGGTSQIQRNIIGERLLGLPREPKPSSSTQGSTAQGSTAQGSATAFDRE
ncbi:MAG TPA: acyl-CoA dehydrogenase family protein [Ilumatobacteraceae bacterium]|nr:acyl-CoA dehydrogenase family protein [Ilumatobacteraceae bacterium]